MSPGSSRLLMQKPVFISEKNLNVDTGAKDVDWWRLFLPRSISIFLLAATVTKKKADMK